MLLVVVAADVVVVVFSTGIWLLQCHYPHATSHCRLAFSRSVCLLASCLFVSVFGPVGLSAKSPFRLVAPTALHHAATLPPSVLLFVTSE